MEDGGLVLDRHARAVAAVEALIAGMGDGALGRATPCPDWDVRALLDHLGGLHRLVGPSVPEPAAADDADPAARCVAAMRAAQRVLRAPGALERSYELPWGATPGALLARLLLADTAIHGWDLARALGTPLPLDPAVCEDVLTWGRAMMRPEFRTPDAGFGPEVPVADAAPACDRLAAFYGRTP
jgi:uncharacterized protein (TIGR03086 family)